MYQRPTLSSQIREEARKRSTSAPHQRPQSQPAQQVRSHLVLNGLTVCQSTIMPQPSYPIASKPRHRPTPLVIPQAPVISTTLQRGAVRQKEPRTYARQRNVPTNVADELARIRMLKRRALRDQVQEMRRPNRR